MFKTLYSCPLTITRHENGPLHESRRLYLEHLAKEGASRSMLLRASGVMYRAAVRMNLDESSPVEQTAVAAAAKEWANRRDGNPNRRSAAPAEREFRQITCDWLRFAGRLQPRQTWVQHQSKIEAFCLYLEKERGLASASIQSTGIHLKNFFKTIPKRDLNKITAAVVEDFLRQKREAGCTRDGLCSLIYALRGFFN